MLNIFKIKNNIYIIKSLVVFYFIFLSSYSLFSQEKDCRYLFIKTTDIQGGPFEIISSERDQDKLDTLAKFTQKAVEVATLLGYQVPPHHLNFVPSDKFAVFLSTSGYASPHWIDGFKIVNEYKSNAGVLEVVFPGNSTCRSFYKDTNGLCDQLSTILHVMGHNDVSDGNFLSVMRRADSVAASKYLSDLMIKLYETNHEDVSRFYQYLDVLTYLQGFMDGSYKPYTDFIPSKPNELEISEETNQVLYNDGLFTKTFEKPKPTIPSSPTMSIYQAMSATYEKAPEWQKRLIRYSEERSRNFPFVLNTKFMNEGWATFSEWFLTKHMPEEYRTSDYLVQYAQLASRVSYPMLDNPYWLGLESWFRIYKRFSEKNSSGSDLEKDQKFVKYAHDIIHNMTDSTFLSLGLDETWVNKYNLVLSRESTEEELEAKGVQPKQGKAYLTVVSTDHKRIIRKIVKDVTGAKRSLPEISLVNLDYESSYVLYKHRVIDDVPLKFEQSSMALWVLSQLHKKTVAIDTIYNDIDHVANIRIIVSPKGEVKIMVLDSNPEVSLEEIAQLEKQLADVVSFYQMDLALTYDKVSENPSLEEAILSNRLFQTRINTYTNDLIKSIPSYVAVWTPSAWRAINEYFTVVQKRVARQISGILSGKQKINISSTGVRVRALPILPHFALDTEFLEDKINSLPPAPLDHFLVAKKDSERLSFLHESESEVKPSNLSPDDRTRVHSYPGVVGDIIEVDAMPSGATDSMGGNGEAKDPSYVEIPLNEWGEILAQYLSLKNIKHIKGKNKALHSKRKGRLSMYKEPLNFTETFNKALKYGIADYLVNQQEEGKELSLDDIGSESISSFVENGIGIMPPEEMVHIPMRKQMKPDFDAVVVFSIDLSGSMQGELQEQAKRFVWSTVSFLRQKYKRVDIRYVGYDMDANEFPEEKIWNTYLGGGTRINQGFLKAEQILDTYPSTWSKYVYNISDAGDFDPVSVVVDTIDHLRSKVQHFGFIHADLDSAWYDRGFVQTLEALPNDIRNFGFTKITGTPQSILQALYDLFGDGNSH